MTGERETIFALSSGAGMAAVAVVRLSGPRSGEVLRMLSGRELPAARRLSLRRLRDPRDGGLLDEALVAWLPGPGTFTGEDMVELHVHGGRATVAAVLQTLGRLTGLRMAEPGEFTRRAFMAGRMSLMEVEGLADLLRAETAAQRRLALRAMSGASRAEVARWREGLVRALSRLEAAIDFVDEEDVAAMALAGLGQALEELVADMERALDAARPAERLREGVRVVIAGPPNVGKSSLINALARREVAIVADVPGTTRDVLEVRLDLGGVPVIVADTAGLRESARDAVERMGQARARELVRAADVVIVMRAPDVEGEELPAMVPTARLLRVLNKADLLRHGDSPARGPADADVVLSLKEGRGLDLLEARLAEMARELFAPVEAAVVTRARQRQALESAVAALRDAMAMENLPLELMAERVRQAVRALERVVGRVDVEELLEHIFAEFCVGK